MERERFMVNRSPELEVLLLACRAQWERIGLHSFRAPTGLVRTFLARDEILDLMMGWDVLHHCEGRGPEHEHAAGPPERHGVVEIVARRTADTVG